MSVPLELNGRSEKPRQTGLTHVLDKGLSVREVDDLAEVAGRFTDIVKLGWGTALITGNLEAKLERYRAHGLIAMVGGTLVEIALRDGRIEELLAWLRELGIDHIEISDGSITLESSAKLALIERLASDGFVVLSEVGSKDSQEIMAPYRWVELIEAELEAGAWKVITEARETGTAGIYRPDGEVRMGLIDEIAHAVDPQRLLFEAPQREQQVWFLQRFGPEVSLGNIAPADVLTLETLRLGLRADTMEPLA
ncbi:MAG TPA: phosphosulfolactate synthase [Baekduia sp.]|nr:phosphosulfolactate synthase [Baekduia sp.]